jgi:hypothetical protein
LNQAYLEIYDFFELQKPWRVLSIGLDTLDGSTLTHRQVVINKILWNPICQRRQSGGDLLVSAMAKFFGGISSLLKIRVLLRQLLCDILEEIDTHSKTATKIVLRKCWILHKIAPRQLVVAFYPFSL